MKKLEVKNSQGADVIMYIKKPTAKDYTTSEIYANKVAVEMLNAKTTTGEPAFIMRSQLKDYLLKTGVWTPDKEKQVRELSEKIEELETKLKAGGITKIEGRKIALQILDLKDDQIRLLMGINELDNLTVEHHTENAKIDSLCSSCFLDESGKRIFESVDECVEKFNEEDYYKTAKEELKKMVYGEVNIEDIMKERMEYKYLFHFKFVNDKFELVNSEGNLVDRAGNLIDTKEIVNNNIEELDFSKFTD